MDRVENDELLYRRILGNGQSYKRIEDGTLKLSQSAFADKRWRPSVDRAKLRDYDPVPTRGAVENGVVSLRAAQVRGLSTYSVGENGGTVPLRLVDVEPAPIHDNPSHAEIFASPGPEKDRVFEKIRLSLANMSKWELEPPDA